MKVKGSPPRAPKMTVTKIATLEGDLTAWETSYGDTESNEHRFPTEALKQFQRKSKLVTDECSELDGQPFGPVTDNGEVVLGMNTASVDAELS